MAAHPTQSIPGSGRIAVGIIRKAHGVHGEASVEPWTDSAERFGELKSVLLVSPDETGLRQSSIASWRAHGERVLVRFEGIDSPEDVREVRDWTVEIPESEAHPREEGEFFLHDLVGLRLIDAEGAERGTVAAAGEGGGGVLLTVERSDGRRFEVPFAAPICTGIDLPGKRMTVDLPSGLEDLESLACVEDEPLPELPASAIADRAAEPAEPSLRIDVVTIFPRMLDPLLAEGVVSRAVRAGLLRVKVWDLRESTSDRHRSTDDEAYGGGPGMVMLAEPVFRCFERICSEQSGASPRVILTSPQGRPFDHETARRLSRERWLIFLCGRYEGLDERVRETLVHEELSVGDFVVSGGELPAMLMIDAIGRLVEGVVGNSESVAADSFFHGLLDHPHYTRPAEFRGLRVPDVLLSGHAEKIRKWRKQQALRQTLRKRPDLLERAELDSEALQMLDAIENESGE
jgi:tRNA (guanine37-N1)-methyltransferase